ncbi:MAG: hypothetical protein CR979_01600, partial [Propionibacterium sp.]
MSNVSIAGIRGVLNIILGTGLGIFIHGIFAGVGVSKIIAESPILFSLLKILGILFLFYLGIRFIVLAFKSNNKLDSHKEVSIKESFLLNIFNAKALLFYITVVPIFAGINFINYIYLSLLHILTMAIWLLICGFVFVFAQEKMKSSKFEKVINLIGGVVLIGLA